MFEIVGRVECIGKGFCIGDGECIQDCDCIRDGGCIGEEVCGIIGEYPVQFVPIGFIFGVTPFEQQPYLVPAQPPITLGGGTG